MPFFNNKRKDFSIQPPKQSIANGAFSVLDTANIDFTYANDILSANLTLTGVTAGTYGDGTNVPQFTVDIWGRITGVTLVPITGGGGGVLTLNNGLTLTGTNGQLGGTLVQNTTVDGTTFPITFTSARTTSFATMYVVNTNTGLGLEVISQNYIPIRATTQPSSTNTVVPTLILERYSTGLVSAGLGQSIVMNAQVTSGSRAGSTNLISKLTNVTPGSWVSQFEIEGVNSGVLSRLFALTGPGQLILDKYTTATSFASVSGASVGVLNVDNAGNVFVGAGGGGGTITLSPIGSSPNANAATITGTVLNLEPASSSFGGVVTVSGQTFAGAKTFQDQLTIDDGLVLSQNSNGVSGTNADINTHPKTNIRLTNGGLVSLASISTSAVVTGHQLWLHNDTGNSIIIVNNYGSAPVGSRPILTSLGANITIPNQGSIILEYDSTDSAWRLVGYPSPLTTKGDINTFSTVNTRLAVGTNGFFLQANSATTTGLEYTDTLANGTKATTQPVADNSTKIATTAYVTTAIRTLSPYQRQTFWNRNTGGAATIIYVAANDVLYVANNSLGNVYCYNCVTGALITSIPVAAVIGLFYYPVTGTVYASNTSNGACVRISTAATPTNLGTVTLVVQWSTTGVEYSATKGFTTTPSSVEVFNPTTNLSITNIAVANPVGCCLNTNGASVQNDRLIVTGSAGITIINATTNAITAAATSVGGAISVSPTAGARRIIYIASQDIYVVCDSVFSRLCWLTPATATTFTASYFTYSLNRCWSLEYDSVNQVILVVGTNTTVGSITIASPVILWIIDALTRVCLRTIVTNSNCLSASYLDCYVQIKTPGVAIVSALGSNMSTEIIYA